MHRWLPDEGVSVCAALWCYGNCRWQTICKYSSVAENCVNCGSTGDTTLYKSTYFGQCRKLMNCIYDSADFQHENDPEKNPSCNSK